MLSAANHQGRARYQGLAVIAFAIFSVRIEETMIPLSYIIHVL
jgi:hypothetical protein